jgi:hypothetical protein
MVTEVVVMGRAVWGGGMVAVVTDGLVAMEVAQVVPTAVREAKAGSVASDKACQCKATHRGFAGGSSRHVQPGK